MGQAGKEGCSFGDLTGNEFLKSLDKNTNILTYYTILLRDLSVLAITVIFLIYVGQRENSLKQQLTLKEDVLDVMDLQTVLGSVTPLMAFSKYLG